MSAGSKQQTEAWHGNTASIMYRAQEAYWGNGNGDSAVAHCTTEKSRQGTLSTRPTRYLFCVRSLYCIFALALLCL